MSEIPKSLLSSQRSAFSLIDPLTSQLHRQYDRHGNFSTGLRTHVAISYVWSEWKNTPTDRLPDWERLRPRLISLVGPNAPKGLKSETWGVTRCWLDSKCIDQSSEDDKAYWVHRMDEVYFEARCTMLLLGPDCDLTPLLSLEREMKCEYRGRLKFTEYPHKCLLTQSCTVLPDISVENEQKCLECLKAFAAGIWRRRAWILQEILLSQNYLVSWDDHGSWLRLSDIGVIAAALFQRNPGEKWAGEFADWCRRLWYLREYYGEAQLYELSDANIIQLAANQEATVPSDKYYALCGILRLKDVKTNSGHTADEALHTIISALIRKGRMSWLYAIPPTLNSAGLQLYDGEMAQFVLTRLKERMSPNAKTVLISSSTMTLDAVPRGIVTRSIPLQQVLHESFSWLRTTRNFEFPPNLRHCHLVPALVRRLCLEIVEPLLLEPMFSKCCRLLELENIASHSRKCWLLIFILCILNEDILPDLRISQRETYNAGGLKVLKAAAQSLQDHIHKVKNHFALLIWRRNAIPQQQNIDDDKNLDSGLGFPNCPEDATIFAIKGDNQLLFAAAHASPTANNTENTASFHGMVLQLNVPETIGHPPAAIFTKAFWKGLQWSPSAQKLTFSCLGLSV